MRRHQNEFRNETCRRRIGRTAEGEGVAVTIPTHKKQERFKPDVSWPFRTDISWEEETISKRQGLVVLVKKQTGEGTSRRDRKL